MGEISVLKINCPSVGLSWRGRTTSAVTVADILFAQIIRDGVISPLFVV